MFHGKTKHVKLKFHSLQEVVQEHEVMLLHYSSLKQIADIFTKPLPKAKFEVLRQKMGVINKRAQEDLFFSFKNKSIKLVRFVYSMTKFVGDYSIFIGDLF